ncbi:MAG TPA: hypothetical protein VE175_14690 [Woeseiaceae bacterium]|nr:hypothetical protein [Woeseiaceae bacterium]
MLLALAVTAALATAGPVTNAEVMQGAAFDEEATGGRADGQAVDLEPLRTEAANIAAASSTVYAEAAHMLDRLANSSFPDEQVRAEAIAALRTAARVSYELGVPNKVLVDAVETASAGQQPASAGLKQLIANFDTAKAEFDRSADQLLTQIRILQSHEATREAIADEIARLEVDAPQKRARLEMTERNAKERERVALEALIDSAQPYAAAQKALSAAISGLVPVLAGTTTRQGQKSSVLLSVYEFLDERATEEEGYGLYTYVLLVPGTNASRRNVAFLKELLASTNRAGEEFASVRRHLNIFYVPTQNRVQALVLARSSADAAAAIAAPGVYHYERAQRLLLRLCIAPATRNPKLCSSGWRGPYLLTLPEPLSAAETVPAAHLFVDLSDIHERAFGEFIRAIKEQVMQPDFTDRQKVDTLRLRLLDITLKAADWLNPIKEGVAEIVFLGGEKAQ